MAISNRQPAGTVIHSDHLMGFHPPGPGSWPGTIDGIHRRMLRQRHDRVVLGRMQTELLNRRRWRTRIELANAIFE